MTDATAYHRKLAEKIWDASRGVNGGVPQIVESFAAAIRADTQEQPHE